MFTKKLIIQDSFTVTAHSGCENTKPNSLDSLNAANRLNCDIAEVDVRFTDDGIPVMAHDRNFKNDVTTLEEAFSLVSGFDTLRLNLDIKETTFLRNIIPLAEKYGLTGRVFCTGIFAKDTYEMKKQLPDYTYYLNIGIRPRILQNKKYYDALCRTIKENNAVGLNCNHKNVTKQLIDYLHKNNLLVSIWTVDKKEDMKRCLTLGADNITTRHPSELINIITEKKNG